MSSCTQPSYDALGNLTAVALPDGTMIDYLVDGHGRRIGKQVNHAPVQGFLYRDRLAILAELDGFGQVVSRFVWADGTGAEGIPVITAIGQVEDVSRSH